MNTYSIALRLRRATYEDAYVAVPVTDAIMEKKADGSRAIDTEALFAAGVRIGQDSRVEWRAESTSIELHPVQQPRPDGRQSVDTYYDLPPPSNT
jgi:hypothetical protein